MFIMSHQKQLSFERLVKGVDKIFAFSLPPNNNNKNKKTFSAHTPSFHATLFRVFSFVFTYEDLPYFAKLKKLIKHFSQLTLS